jgi:hypothetical protein
MTSIPVSTNSTMLQLSAHTWFNHFAHVLRSDQRILRCQIKEILVHAHHISLRVVFHENGRIKKKEVSPFSILCLHLWWWCRDIISDDEILSEDTTTHTETMLLPPFRLHEGVRSMVQEPQLQSLYWLMRQTDLLQKCHPYDLRTVTINNK